MYIVKDTFALSTMEDSKTSYITRVTNHLGVVIEHHSAVPTIVLVSTKFVQIFRENTCKYSINTAYIPW